MRAGGVCASREKVRLVERERRSLAAWLSSSPWSRRLEQRRVQRQE
uniref:Uncharacterized protein n=1 Tax=Arundo donax TaxID=35708 RepID=A0A0A9G845_ARUDO